MRFEGHDGEHFRFQCVTPGWEADVGELRLTFDEVRARLYDLVAENPAFRS